MTKDKLKKSQMLKSKVKKLQKEYQQLEKKRVVQKADINNRLGGFQIGQKDRENFYQQTMDMLEETECVIVILKEQIEELKEV